MSDRKYHVLYTLGVVVAVFFGFLGIDVFMASFTLLAISFWVRSFDEQDLANDAPVKGFLSAAFAGSICGGIHINGGYLKLFLFAIALAISAYYAFIKSGFFDVPPPLKGSSDNMHDGIQIIIWLGCTLMISLNIMALIFMKLYGYYDRPED